ncbi:hypothetical protein QWJ34_14660 [Saccharibacillus sp. CPCC 101409]|uniref:hypothetical protein n=1 Tax=Saccharibacillus sp. CPCC 101409 TaxID=3058041 RepID=UPI0026733322|nr:hypothetical protein [Saccharibacillus sp. CPCC 101409]MDO3411003.1 hypothetical protein [Saccharibacillus sp. CPCC 101409]
MWVWVYNSTNAETKDAFIHDTGTSVQAPIYDGQLFLQDNSSPGNFYTWDRAHAGWVKVTAINGVNTAQKTATISIYTGFDFIWEQIYRLDNFNCSIWNSCTADGKWGSHYSLRSPLKIYTDDGNLAETLPSTYRIEFTGGYGFTKSSTLPTNVSGVGIRASGWKNASGNLHSYGTNIRFATVDFKAHPLSYGINTA